MEVIQDGGSRTWLSSADAWSKDIIIECISLGGEEEMEVRRHRVV